jgi:hypothetical protein
MESYDSLLKAYRIQNPHDQRVPNVEAVAYQLAVLKLISREKTGTIGRVYNHIAEYNVGDIAKCVWSNPNIWLVGICPRTTRCVLSTVNRTTFVFHSFRGHILGRFPAHPGVKDGTSFEACSFVEQGGARSWVVLDLMTDSWARVETQMSNILMRVARAHTILPYPLLQYHSINSPEVTRTRWAEVVSDSAHPMRVILIKADTFRVTNVNREAYIWKAPPPHVLYYRDGRGFAASKKSVYDIMVWDVGEMKFTVPISPQRMRCYACTPKLNVMTGGLSWEAFREAKASEHLNSIFECDLGGRQPDPKVIVAALFPKGNT